MKTEWSAQDGVAMATLISNSKRRNIHQSSTHKDVFLSCNKID